MNQLTWGEVNRWMDEWNERRRDGPKEGRLERGNEGGREEG